MKEKDAASKLEYMERVRLSPLIAIDLIVKNKDGKILLGLRKNAPSKNKWFVPGGCIRKNETLDNAFTRITLNEIGHRADRKDAAFYSIGEHFYKNENAFDIEGIDTHYVVITYLIHDLPEIDLSENDQHFMFKWMSAQEILESDDVHENTKILFR